MGQSPTPINRLNNQWNFVDNLDGIQVYKNQHNQLAQKHIVKTDPKIDEQDYITAYYQRYLPSKPIVNVFDAQFLQRSSSMCQNTTVMTVFTEFIPHRLSDVKNLNHGQGIYVLSQALAGFSQLYGRVGPFQIHEDLIGFNQEGEVRVWYNPNFADNSVDNDRIILMSTINPYDFDTKFSQNQEHDMIEDIINAVARYTQFHPQFLQQAQELRKMSFSQAIKILSNQIARKAYYVPDHLFLGDKGDIIRKSGVEIKHRHIVDPNKPKKGTKYPYFVDNTNTNINQVQYNQNYQQGHFDYDTDSDSSSDYNQGGYYNLNGQNYRIIGTKEIQGNEINEQAILDEIVRKNNIQSQQQVYAQTPNYTQVSSKYDHHSQYYNTQQQSFIPQKQQIYTGPLATQYVQKPTKQYQQGHIVVRENPQVMRNSNIKMTTLPIYQQQPQPSSQQNVRVFSVGENGRLVEERQFNSTYQSNPQLPPAYQPPTYQSNIQPQTFQRNVQFQPHYQQGSTVRQGNASTVYPLNFAQNPQNQAPITFSHRNKIFEPTSPQRMVRQPQNIPQQKAF